MIKDYGCYRKYVDSLNIRRRWWHRWKGRLQRSRPKCYIFGKIIGCGRHHLGSAQCPLLVQLGSSIGGSTRNGGKDHWYNLDVEHDDDDYNYLIDIVIGQGYSQICVVVAHSLHHNRYAHETASWNHIIMLHALTVGGILDSTLFSTPSQEASVELTLKWKHKH